MFRSDPPEPNGWIYFTCTSWKEPKKRFGKAEALSEKNLDESSVHHSQNGPFRFLYDVQQCFTKLEQRKAFAVP